MTALAGSCLRHSCSARSAFSPFSGRSAPANSMIWKAPLIGHWRMIRRKTLSIGRNAVKLGPKTGLILDLDFLDSAL
jgi:hypothetical protein